MAITRTDQLYRQNEHAAVIAHGAHPEYRLEFPAEVDGSDSNFSKIFQGSVVSLNSDGKYVCGCGVGTGANFPVPCISLKNVFDPDVTTGKLGTTAFVTGTSFTVLPDYRKSTYSAVGGVITAIPCTGGYEIETTEIDIEATYNVNDAVVPGTGDNLGKLVPFTGSNPYLSSNTAPVVGFVSKGIFSVDSYQQKRISFFTHFVPVAHAAFA